VTKVLITGASGFIGRNLCLYLKNKDFEIVPVFRNKKDDSRERPEPTVFVDSIDAATNWKNALGGIDVIVHLAGKVKGSGRENAMDRASFFETNVNGTRNLANQAAQCGVKRLVYLSSVKVNGGSTNGVAFTAEQDPMPDDLYAISNLEAETTLKKISAETGLEVMIIRAPLVYGPGMKGNLRALSKAVSTGIPLPLGMVKNRRDLVSIFNLCDFIRTCILHPSAAASTFLVSDNEGLSTVELIRYLCSTLNRKARLFPVPPRVLHFVARVVGKKAIIEKLTEDLEVDISTTRRVLNWDPPFTVWESFRKMTAERTSRF
jgi:UDP-glucose 4-epimerase